MLYVYYDKPIGIVKYHFKHNDKNMSVYCGIYECNGLFAIVYRRKQLIMFASDIHHFARCLGIEGKDKENLFKKEFTDWTLSADNTYSRAMMLRLIRTKEIIKYANQSAILDLEKKINN